MEGKKPLFLGLLIVALLVVALIVPALASAKSNSSPAPWANWVQSGKYET